MGSLLYQGPTGGETYDQISGKITPGNKTFLCDTYTGLTYLDAYVSYIIDPVYSEQVRQRSMIPKAIISVQRGFFTPNAITNQIDFEVSCYKKSVRDIKTGLQCIQAFSNNYAGIYY